MGLWNPPQDLPCDDAPLAWRVPKWFVLGRQSTPSNPSTCAASCPTVWGSTPDEIPARALRRAQPRPKLAGMLLGCLPS